MIIQCRDLSFGYDGKPAIAGLNFTVDSGDYLCVVGPNGSGKSTLIKGLLGLLKPLGGTLEYDWGRDPSGRARKPAIGYVSQAEAAKMDFPASVYEIALSGNLGHMGLRPFYNRAEKKLARDNLERLGIASLGGRCFRELSGGQQRRTLLARSLCAVFHEDEGEGRRLLILDEPAAGLDSPSTKEFYDLLHRINQEQGITIIMVSHDLEAVDRFAGKILSLEGGRQCLS